MSNNTLRAYATLAVGVVAIAWSAIFVRWTHMPGLASAFYRVLFAAAVLWPIRYLSGARTSAIGSSTLRLAALGGAFFAGDIALYNVAVLHTTAGGATLLGNNAPVFVGILTWIITRRPPPRQFWMILAIASAGVILIMRVDAHQLGLEFSGDLFAIGTSVCFACYLLATERLRGSCDTTTLLAISSTASAAVLLLAAIVTQTSLRIPDLPALAAVLGLALVCQIVGYFSLTYALGHLPATLTSVILLAVAPLTALFAFFFFDERMTRSQVFGGILVLLGVWLAGRMRGVVRFPAVVE